ncbi:hypothetical protein JOF56_003874 [Kibdelosporangium banguiense]|uniref:Carboxypeptidase regulatory-like domain-containing protein n=1 Tax=Kibdelosporangium banguiense TaxID=1365924 RepID=A0ABS4TGD8_9PSEU|nr:hypothetical protein [Kibdelosporangium banguiense]MBP2323489.1 hypothetical protein [Kibdelosporangium banguiense]
MRAVGWIGVMALAAIAIVGSPSTVSAARPPAQNVLEVVTVPPLPSAKFTLDGKPLVTDDKGVARATVRRSRDKHQLQLLTPHLDIPGGSADFVRWVGRGDAHPGFTPSLPNLVIGRNTRIQAAFQSTRIVRYDFVDQARNPVAPDRITSLTIRSDSGQHLTLEGGRPVRLTAVRPVLEAGSAVGKEVTYYLQSVVIDGTNVVNAGEQRLMPNRTADAKFVVLLRSVRFQVRDWLFGDPLASAIELTYPDGRAERLTAGLDGDAELENLARGDYQVKASGSGYSQAREIALSRSQYVELPVVTYVDVVTLTGAALAMLTVLIVVGRRLVVGRRRLRKRSRTVA